MITTKYRATLLAFSAALLLAACKNGPLASGPEAEAKKAAQAHWDALITKCGDDHYSIDSFNKRVQFLTQLKDPQVVTTTREVNEATKLNGFEMVGSTSVNIKAYRVSVDGKWEEWRQPGGFGGIGARLSTSMFRKNGQWYFGDPAYQPYEPIWKSVDCAQIPK
jgi:hypothetical protein